MDEIKAARLALKWQLQNEWPGLRCACGEYGATDLGHIVYTRHPDTVHLYSPLNMCLLHNRCNCNERLWVNVNACLVLIQRAGSTKKWLEWAYSIPRKGQFWVPEKMTMASGLWKMGFRAFETDRIQYALEHYVDRPMGGRKGE